MEVTCEHQNEKHLVTVSRFDLQTNNVQIICERCYFSFRDEDEREWEKKNPVLQDHTTPPSCLLCSKSSSVRYNTDLAMNICDSCRLQCINLLHDAETVRIPPTNVIPDEVTPFLYIGCKDAVYNVTGLCDRNIKRVLICCDHLHPPHVSYDNQLIFHRIPIKDSLTQNLELYLPSALEFIDGGIQNGDGVLVHCNAGVSRSGAIVTEWVRRNIPDTHRDVDEAIHYVQERRRIHPNSNFVAQLKRIQQREFSSER
jgi:hypothetical protein